MIIIDEESVAKALKKIDDGEELTQEDKIILRDNPNPIKLIGRPQIITRARNGGLSTEWGYWNDQYMLRPGTTAGEKALINWFLYLNDNIFDTNQCLMVSGKRLILHIYHNDD